MKSDTDETSDLGVERRLVAEAAREVNAKGAALAVYLATHYSSPLAVLMALRLAACTAEEYLVFRGVDREGLRRLFAALEAKAAAEEGES